ncbi:thioredoxin 1 [Thermocatellispora tengchongensis]|uniref:Thioredoxin n=1 Tax=Thermocatellispora tengchongensis TaxID=1073253 RepID=A0A840PLA5_9ACTN|nr:thioredoxin [Thermocatellispora tengchongensis]MBB5140288.1 thioredoxin 1 [Thermocatellispora tengchongensis]
MITLTTQNFEEQVLHNDKPVLVEFWADWCGPCKMVAPVLEQIEAEEGDRLTIGKLDGDAEQEIVARYNVMGFPTMLLFRDGEIVQEIVGARPKRMIMAALEPHL